MWGMIRPRFTLRTLFVLITAISVPIAWVAYHLNWKYKRDDFAIRHHCGLLTMYSPANTPWGIRILGAHQADYLTGVPDERIDEAKSLFPESIINPTPKDFEQEGRRRAGNY